MSKCVSLLPEQSREPRGRSIERPAGGGGAVQLPVPAESSGECHGKGSTRARTAILGRRQRLPRADLTEDIGSHSGSP